MGKNQVNGFHCLRDVLFSPDRLKMHDPIQPTYM